MAPFNENESSVEINRIVPEKNRAYDTRRDTSDQTDLSVGIEDVDRSVKYQFEKRFNLEINDAGKRVRVPVIWDNQEDWAWATKQNRLTTIGNRIVYPICVINRTGISRKTDTDTWPSRFKMEPGVYATTQKWSRKNKYDNFSVLMDRHPVQETFTIHVPRYIELTYEIRILTEQMQQMNHIIEQIAFSDRNYWGDPESGFLFYAKVDDYSPEVSNESDKSRHVKLNINAQVNGYIVPTDSFYESTTKKERSIAKVAISETVVTADEMKARFNNNNNNNNNGK